MDNINLIQCPDCKNLIDKYATICKYCGCVLEKMKKFHVVFQDSDGNMLSEQDVFKGCSAFEPVHPNDFCVWDKEFSNVTSNIVITAKRNSLVDRRGNFVYLGSYPQSEVTDENKKYELIKNAGSIKNWHSYGYFNKENKKRNFMKYIDVYFDGGKYRGVYFTSRRHIQAVNNYEINTAYWFKYEPIEWRILSESHNSIFLFSEKILDSQPFYYKYKPSKYDKYKKSTIRKWLNKTFYDTAFSKDEQKIIRNKLCFHRKEKGKKILDKIFLLREQDILNTDYGFSKALDQTWEGTEYVMDQLRVKYLTSYANVQGDSLPGIGRWLLQDEKFVKQRKSICWVDDISYCCSEGEWPCGVVPALYIDVSK